MKTNLTEKLTLFGVIFCLLFAGFFAINARRTAGATATPPFLWLDSPLNGSTVSGTTVNVSGWALDNDQQIETAISKVEILVDGAKVGNATYGNQRDDVCIVYPNRVGCPNVGFKYAWDTTTLSNGQYTLSIIATDSDTPPHILQKDFTITVNNTLVPTVSITAFPNPITYNSATILTYIIGGGAATSCLFSDAGSGSVSGSDVTAGSHNITTSNLTATSKFTITCTGPGGASAPASVTVTVNTAQVVSPDGSLVLIDQTVYLITNGTRRAFPTPEVFFSYGYTFAQVTPAKSGDLALPEGPVMTLASTSHSDQSHIFISPPFPLTFIGNLGDRRHLPKL